MRLLRTLAAVGLLSFLAFGAASASAAAPAALPAPATWDVRIGDVDADGGFTARGGVEVEIVPIGTDRDGALKRPGGVMVRYEAEGGRAVASLQAYRARLGRHARRLEDRDVVADVRVNLEVGDSGLRAWQLMTLTTRAPGVRRWTAEAPLQLPLLAPAVQGLVLDRGLFPTGLRALTIEIQGDGQLEASGGALHLVGSVAPERPLTLRIRYPIAVPGERASLGLRGVFGETALMVAALGVEPAAPRFESSWPARIGVHREGRERLAGFATLRPVRPGEVVTLAVVDLPERARRPRTLLASLVFGLGLLALGAATRRRGA